MLETWCADADSELPALSIRALRPFASHVSHGPAGLHARGTAARRTHSPTCIAALTLALVVRGPGVNSSMRFAPAAPEGPRAKPPLASTASRWLRISGI